MSFSETHLNKNALENVLIHRLFDVLVGQEKTVEHVGELNDHIEASETDDCFHTFALLTIDDTIDNHVDEQGHILVEEA